MNVEEQIIIHFVNHAREKEDAVDVISGDNYFVVIKPELKLEVCIRDGAIYAGISPLGLTTSMGFDLTPHLSSVTFLEEPDFIGKIEKIIREF